MLESKENTFSYHYDNDIQDVPDASEVGKLVYSQLKDLLNYVIEDE